MTCLCKTACFRASCLFVVFLCVCVNITCLCPVFLDPAIIVLDVICACGTPWTFLLNFFNKWCKMEDGNVAISLCLIIMLVQH